jgi:RimJ/RimL family protein N-acetyltransferase
MTMQNPAPDAPLPEQFESERLMLRCPRPEDAAMVHASLSHSLPEMRSFAASMPAAAEGIPFETCEAYCRDSLGAYRERTGFEWLMFLKGTDTHVGAIGIHSVDGSVPKGEVGYWMHSGFTGRGYMTEGLRAVTDFGLRQLGLRRIDATPDAANLASCVILERAGYTLEGTLRHHRADPGGGLRDTRLYAIVR